MAKKQPKKPPLPWPRLSETLPHFQVGKCQNCDGASGKPLTHWQECDDQDRRDGPVFVVLCQSCADVIIEDHPRLYVPLLTDDLMPGAMEVCADCMFRERLRCRCPAAKFNGGEGITFDPPPTAIHLHGRGISGWHWMMVTGPELVQLGGQKCSGKKTEVTNG